MDVIKHYSPPSVQTSAVHASSYHSERRRLQEAKSLPEIAAKFVKDGVPKAMEVNDQLPSTQTNWTTFNRSVQISLTEPVGSMSLSPANRDVVLASRKGLYIIDLENPYDQPRFLPHLTTWVPCDIQWAPFPARANWVASTSNNKLLVWNLDRPAAVRMEPTMSMNSAVSATGTSPSMQSVPIISPSTLNGTLPLPPHHQYAELLGTTSKLSSISHVLHAHTRAITDINWSPFHPDVLASCGIDTWTWAWDLRDPSKPKQGYSAWNSAMTQVKWNRATPHRLATSCDNKVLIWDDRKGALPLATIEAHENKIYGVDWSRDMSLGASRLVTCSLDGSVKWWDLDSPAAQHAIANHQLVTEPETTIHTDTPVWRARHLPFGQGVMTLPQRGDTSLSMWSKSQVDEPVHRFNGHRDLVKEYLIRAKGGEDLASDQRQFQLITWSKDQTLRLWPITDEMTRGVGHEPGAPIKIRQTRLNAPNISYRNPPLTPTNIIENTGGVNVLSEKPNMLNVDAANLPGVIHASPLSQVSSGRVTPNSGNASGNASMVPPSGATRSLLSGSAKGPASSNSNGSGSLRITSPQNNFNPFSAGNKPFSPSSLGRDERIFVQDYPTINKKMSMTQMAVRDSQRQKVGRRTGGSSRPSQFEGQPANKFGSASRRSIKTNLSNTSIGQAGHTMSSQKTSSSMAYGSRTSLGNGRERTPRDRKSLSKINTNKVMSKSAASRNFMTRGTMARSGHLSMPGNPSQNAVGWIAGVRMGKELRSASGNRKDVRQSKRDSSIPPDEDAKNIGIQTEPIEGDDGKDGEERKEAAQVLSEEIMTISKALGSTSFEKIDVSAKTCTATCYGPWSSNEGIPCFVRITFHFSSRYPAEAPRFDLEHNASVPLKTRAFLLRNIANTLEDCAIENKPSMEPVLLLLSGHSQQKALPEEGGDDDRKGGKEAFWLPGDEEQDLTDTEDRITATLKIPPRVCGATFAANGMLVTFRPSTKPVVAESGASAMGGTASDSFRTGLAPSHGRSRFLKSYSALAGAMTSLAQLAKEGMSVQDLDVVKLMGDQSFFHKRLQHSMGKAGNSHNQNHRNSHSSSNAAHSTVSKRSSPRPQSGHAIVPTLSSSTIRGRKFEPAVAHSPLAVEGTEKVGEDQHSEERPSRAQSKIRRARSASPVHLHSRHRLLGENVRHESGNASPLLRSAVMSGATSVQPSTPSHNPNLARESRSIVHIWDLKYLFFKQGGIQLPSFPSAKAVPPPLTRRRSATTPSSPAPMTPRTETELAFLQSAIPSSINDSNKAPLPSSITNSLRENNQSGQEFEERNDEDYSTEDEDLINAYRVEDDESSEEDSDEDDGGEDGQGLSSPDSIHPLAEQFLDTLLWLIPFSFLYLMLDILIQQQYAIKYNAWNEFVRVANALPLLVTFIYFTAIKGTSYMPKFVLQFLFLGIGTATGCAFLYHYTKSPQGIVVRQTAPLGTLWIYCTAKMDLSLTIVSLAAIWAFTIHHDLNLFD